MAQAFTRYCSQISKLFSIESKISCNWTSMILWNDNSRNFEKVGYNAAVTGEYHAKVTVKDGILLVKFIGTIQNQFENLNYQKQTLQNKKRLHTWNLMVFVEIYRMVFLHLARLFNLNSTFLSRFFQHVELLLNLVNSIICHGCTRVNTNLKGKKSNIFKKMIILTPSERWTRCISELRHCWTVWYRLNGLCAYLCWNKDDF